MDLHAHFSPMQRLSSHYDMKLIIFKTIILIKNMEDFVKKQTFEKNCQAQFQLAVKFGKWNWDSLIITVGPAIHPPTQAPREHYFNLTQEADIWHAS